MKKFGIMLLILTTIVLLFGCGPTVSVNNTTKFPVRAVVSTGGRSEVLSPSPGESSSADVEEGVYTVTVIPDQEWIDYAKSVRKYLNDQLANSGKLTGQQLLNVVQRLKDIAQQMAAFSKAASASGASCGGSLSQDKTDGLVEVSQRKVQLWWRANEMPWCDHDKRET